MSRLSAFGQRWRRRARGSRSLGSALPWMALVAVAIAGMAAVVLLPPLFTPDLGDPQAQFEVRDRGRLTVAAVFGGVVLLVGAYVNWRRVSALERQVEVAQLGQITERFTRAIDQLGAVRADNTPAAEIRAGGVRSLERIARESPDDFWPILDILAAYLRSVSRTAPPELWPDARQLVDTPLDLSWAFAPRVAFPHKNLDGADVQWAVLRESDFRAATLMRANLNGTDLEEADLHGANLEGANLRSANLKSADLRGVNLQGADLRAADLGRASLEGADLTLTLLDDVSYDESTTWPDGFKPRDRP